MLQKDEDVHDQRIQAIYTQLKASPGIDEWKATVGQRGPGQGVPRAAAAHGQNIKAETGDLEALDVGIDFEFKSVRFYEDQPKVAEDQLEKEFIQHMIAEEKGHHRLVRHEALPQRPVRLVPGAGALRLLDGGTGMA